MPARRPARVWLLPVVAIPTVPRDCTKLAAIGARMISAPVSAILGRSMHPTTYLFGARALRDFGDGFVAVLLPAYLLALGASPVEVGAVATASLLGSALMTIGVGMLGGRYDRCALLIAAAGLMAATGAAFAAAQAFAPILVIAFVGTINPSAGSVSLFVPLEHAALAREVGDADRTRMFARYSLVGALAAAVGAFAAGVPELMAALGLDRLAALRLMFLAYAALGVAGGLLYSRIPKRPPSKAAGAGSVLGQSRPIVLRLAALFSLDAFAGGFVVQSLMVLWLFERFGMPLPAAGTFFFASGVLSAFSFPVAAWL